ncbi:Rab family GTPase [Legionella anisa]|uniref:GTP-binding protein n=1 Tax=Legionella anisa TaxID=28082 RepID=A0AAX0WT11_9GAMM|nr:Rab family GTPase [Legionella anisa]AWN74371.1 GTP-binding protein [Legionella anisa]KTC71948.1 Rho GTPase (Miro-like) [Legionella anisa]MBN5935253.1 GTP-binding protein [Legionella anisa]MCW8425531.1 GTP-binding protein [Legionella anisa]MCW8449038.1 GTP-binding protein [Legionella anisa]
MQYKVVLFGKHRSGKTQLNYRIALKASFKFKENSRSTIGADFLTREIDSDNTAVLWDTAGALRYQALNQVFYKGAAVGVFCIDLTEEINEQEIIKNIQEFRLHAPNAPIICVGTKSDLPNADACKLNILKSKELFVHFITTSAKEGDNVDELFLIITKLCKDQQNSLWSEAKAKLIESLRELPKGKKQLIEQELTKLSDVLLAKAVDPSVTPLYKAKAIENFTANCKVILDEQHPNVLNGVLSVAAAAIVLIVTALIGFTIGVACSWWTGPGAFFAGLLSAHTAAVAVASSSTVLGAVAGSLTAYSLFKPSKEINALNEFAADVSSLNPGIIL